MAEQTTGDQWILLPSTGMTATSAGQAGSLIAFERSTRGIVKGPLPQTGGQLRVLDSVHEDGAKLIQMSPDHASDFRASNPGLRLMPVIYYRSAVMPHPAPRPEAAVAATRAAAVKSVVRVVSKRDDKPIAGAMVVAFTNFRNRIGAQGATNSKGEVALPLAAGVKLQRLYVFPQLGFWPLLQRAVWLAAGMQVGLAPIDLAYTDALRYFYGAAAGGGAGVKVGVIDTGIAAHPDLAIQGGANTVVGEAVGDYGDNGEGHGTHVAGIIAARGAPPAGIRGLAPAVALRSYRVFGKNNPEASNYSILKAIDRAVADGCDLINMSLGGGDDDPALTSAIAQARASGSLVIAAAGNDGRQEVSFPARDSLAIAISALGRKRTFPSNAAEAGDVRAPYGTDRKDFIAAFSNIGPEIDLTAPGVGIISTYPGGYAVLDGTSMACPATTGVAARLLAGRADLLSMARGQARSDAIATMLLQSAHTLGFESKYEGQGLPK